VNAIVIPGTLAEVGKPEKTIYLCSYLASRETQREVQEGLKRR
jgi:TnpA family transposase